MWDESTRLSVVITPFSEVRQMMGVKLAQKVKKMAGYGESMLFGDSDAALGIRLPRALLLVLAKSRQKPCPSPKLARREGAAPPPGFRGFVGGRGGSDSWLRTAGL